MNTSRQLRQNLLNLREASARMVIVKNRMKSSLPTTCRPAAGVSRGRRGIGPCCGRGERW